MLLLPELINHDLGLTSTSFRSIISAHHLNHWRLKAGGSRGGPLMIRVDRFGFWRLMLLLLAACGSTVYAQQITGSITGSVVDSSGAAVVGASVKLTNTGTAFVQTTMTDASGNFQFLLL